MTNNPTSIKLGELKPALQREAHEKERSLHWLILDILKKHLGKKTTKK